MKYNLVLLLFSMRLSLILVSPPPPSGDRPLNKFTLTTALHAVHPTTKAQVRAYSHTYTSQSAKTIMLMIRLTKITCSQTANI